MGMKNFWRVFVTQKEYVFGYSSVLGLLSSLIYTCFAVLNGEWGVKFTVVLIFLALVNTILAISVFIMTHYYHKNRTELDNIHDVVRNKEKEIELLEQRYAIEIERQGAVILKADSILSGLSTTIHNILHETRTVYGDMYKSLCDIQGFKQAKAAGAKDIEFDICTLHSIEKTFEMFMVYLVDNIKNLMDQMTSDNCAVCIKILIKGKEEDETGKWRGDPNLAGVHVKTFMRDAMSFRERGVIDAKLQGFPYYKNTAFKRILETQFPDDSWFICNDLTTHTEYENIHADWHKLYNACIVTPIRIPDGENFRVIGFLCVDNRIGNFSFDKGMQFVAAIGDNMFHLFNTYNDLKNMMSEEMV